MALTSSRCKGIRAIWLKNDIMLTVTGLSFHYPHLLLFKNIHFSLEAGKLLHLQGKNGAGKTTLLRLLAGLMEPTTGEIFYQGKPIHKDLKQYQKNIGYISHKSGINPLLTVSEQAYFDSHWPKNAKPLTEGLMEFQLDKMALKPCYQLSQGQLHKLSLLRLRLMDKPLWLLDEPFVALDEDAIKRLANLFLEQLKKGGQIIITSHQSLPKALNPIETLSL